MKKFLKLMDVKKIVGVSGSKIYSMAKEGTFPKPIKIGHRSMRWLRDDINGWIACKSNCDKYEGTKVEEIKIDELVPQCDEELDEDYESEYDEGPHNDLNILKERFEDAHYLDCDEAPVVAFNEKWTHILYKNLQAGWSVGNNHFVVNNGAEQWKFAFEGMGDLITVLCLMARNAEFRAFMIEQEEKHEKEKKAKADK